MKRAIILGNFSSSSINGQTVKSLITKDCLGILEKNIYDTSLTPIASISRIYLFLKEKEKLKIVICGKHALIVLLIASLFIRQGKYKLIYIAPGGWISRLLKKYTFIRKIYKGLFAMTFVESNEIVRDLGELGMKAVWISNPRPSPESLGIKIVMDANKIKPTELRLTFLSRICAEKGFDIFCETVAETSSLLLNYNIKVVGDVYGPISPAYSDTFYRLMNKYSKITAYKGTLGTLSGIYTSLHRSHFLLLPTSYKGECLPGALVESIMVGTPVICSDHNYLKEYIKMHENGLIISSNDFIGKASREIVNLFLNPHRYYELRKSTLVTRESFLLSHYQRTILSCLSNFDA